MQLMGEHHLDTTWVVDYASQLSWVATLYSSSTRHDLALNITWATQELSPGKFQRHFRDRWEACEQVSIVPTTVYCPEPDLLRQRLSHLAQYGLTTCITLDDLRNRWQSGPSDCLPHPLPLGLWQLPTTARIPSQRTWLYRIATRRLPGIGRNGSSMAGMHVLIAAEQVIAQGRGGLRQLDHFLRKVAWASSAYQLEVITAAQWTANTARCSAAMPQRSILHTAA
jgi:hypothetical protein